MVRLCAACVFERAAEMANSGSLGPNVTASSQGRHTCGRKEPPRPEGEERPLCGATRFDDDDDRPCVLKPGHDSMHTDAAGDSFGRFVRVTAPRGASPQEAREP